MKQCKKFFEFSLIESTPMDNYDVKDNSLKMELVKEKAYKAALPHSGACAQYDAVNGSSYNTRRR